jgi:hypothetical protein
MATMKSAIATMKAAQISRPGGEFQIVEREIPKPADGQVRIQNPSLRNLPQRRRDERRDVSLDSVPPHSRTRSCGHYR